MTKLAVIKDQLQELEASPREKDLLARALKFAQENPKVLIMILDPKKEDIIAGYGKTYAAINIKSRFLKLKVKVVSQLLRGKDVGKNINRILLVWEEFLYKLVEKLNPNLKVANQPNNQNYGNQKEKGESPEGGSPEKKES